MSQPFAVDVSFDFRSDTPEGRDPDSFSPALKLHHQYLWSRRTPNGTALEWVPRGRSAYLVHGDGDSRIIVASDTIASSHRKKLSHLYDQVDWQINEAFHATGYTIGGMLVFPLNPWPVKGQTINQRRGTSHEIQDRIDLTLECIRLYYSDQQSPLAETLGRYRDFFDLFVNFDGYVRFFVLDDLVRADGTISFFRRFDGFDGRPLPRDLPEYLDYREKALEFVNARNARIAAAFPG